jgi:hypothetical protein
MPFWKKVDKQQQLDALFLAIKEDDPPKAKKLVTPHHCVTSAMLTRTHLLSRLRRSRAGSMM